MDYRKFNNKILVRLEKGEEIVESIRTLANKEQIKLGTITGIGAVNKATIGLFEVDTKVYNTIDLEEDMEIVSLGGNITEKDGEVYIHLHIAISNSTYNVKAGHLNSAIISATGEVVIDIIEGTAGRRFDKEAGLNLLEF